MFWLGTSTFYCNRLTLVVWLWLKISLMWLATVTIAIVTSLLQPAHYSWYALFDHSFQRHLCTLLFLTPRLPAFWISQRLNSHALELMHLDRAVINLGLHQLTDTELKQVWEILDYMSIIHFQLCLWWMKGSGFQLFRRCWLDRTADLTVV